ncbi:MAG: glycoside hydrolase family 25 protein [Proteobacteria bacterium]|nr:glycoside hydrolase family 25 protein [Pseudomonadota bacterium]
MIPRRGLLAGLAALSGLSLAGCGGRHATTAPSYAYAPPGGVSWSPKVDGLDAVIDISHNVQVSDFSEVRKANILAVIHKTTEGGDWIDPSYAPRRVEAESNGLLWGAYHFGTRQYSGVRQAQTFLAAARPTPRTLLALDFEPNDLNPNNTMTLQQAEDFVRTVHHATGRLPIVYTHAAWANGMHSGRRGVRLQRPVGPNSILAQCDLWLADPREEPVVPEAWANRGWRLWQYVANESDGDAAYGTASRAVPGVTHCDRNLFAGNAAELHRYWGIGRARA